MQPQQQVSIAFTKKKKKKERKVYEVLTVVSNDYSPLQYDAMSSTVNIMVFQGNLLPPDYGDSRFL
jgi:hypothetical protein